MTLAFTVVLTIDNPDGVRINPDITEEFRREVSESIIHRLDMHGFQGRIIDEESLTVEDVTVAPSTHP